MPNESDFKRRNNTIIVLSIISLISVLLIPIYSAYDGLIPEFDDWTFGEVVKEIMDDYDNAFHYYRVSLTIFTFITSVFLVVFSLCQKRVLIILTSVAGVLAIGNKLAKYINQYGIDHVLNFEDGSLGIGFWIPIIMFVLCFALSLKTKINQSK